MNCHFKLKKCVLVLMLALFSIACSIDPEMDTATLITNGVNEKNNADHEISKEGDAASLGGIVLESDEPDSKKSGDSFLGLGVDNIPNITKLENVVSFSVINSHPQHECLNRVLDRFVNVFGVYVISHNSIPNEYIMHTANVLAEYIDNDIDGVPDDVNVHEQLINGNYVVPVWTKTLREKTMDSVRADCEDEIGFAASMYYGEDEWALNGIIEDGLWDTNLEEVWHVVSKGWYKAYPEYFGDEGWRQASVLTDAMDLARGGKFEKIPQKYPDNSWYSYYDATCDYVCQEHEYFYWALMANLDALDPIYTDKCEHSRDEWHICTQEELYKIDRAVYDLLNDDRFKLPQTIPLGNYPSGGLESSDLITIPVSGNLDSLNTDIKSGYVRSGKGEYLELNKHFNTECGTDHLISTYDVDQENFNNQILSELTATSLDSDKSILALYENLPMKSERQENTYEVLCSTFRWADADLWQTLTGFEWMSVDLDTNEYGVLLSIHYFLIGDSDEVVDRLMSFEWMTDSVVTYEEYAFVNNLHILEEKLAAERYLSLVSSNWMSDTKQNDEYMLLYYLDQLCEIGLTSLVHQITEMPFIQESYEPHDGLALRTLYRLNINFPVIYADTVSADWFQDGVDDDESILLQVLGTNSTLLNSEDLLYFVDNHEISTNPIELPLSGSRTISFIQSGYSEKNLDVVDQVHEAVEEIELFMSIPFPKEEIIMLFANKDQVPERINWIGINFSDHMVMLPTLAKGKDENTTVVHEVAHYYWDSSNSPLWFREGMADFLATYVRDQLGRETFEERFDFSSGDTSLERGIQRCNSLGVKTIKKLVDLLNQDGYAVHSESDIFLCNYTLGEWMLTEIYNLIGEEGFAAAIQILYLSDVKVDDTLIFESFLSVTSESNKLEFEELYTSLYGDF